MDLRPEEKFLRFSELSENRALKPFAHFCVQPAAPGLNYHIKVQKTNSAYVSLSPNFLRLRKTFRWNSASTAFHMHVT